jgi:hypothetical protein
MLFFLKILCLGSVSKCLIVGYKKIISFIRTKGQIVKFKRARKLVALFTVLKGSSRLSAECVRAVNSEK